MSITGIAAIIYGVESPEVLAQSARFFADYGLPLVATQVAENVACFRVESGAEVAVRLLEDPWFKHGEQVGTGVRECIWGVDTQRSFDALLADLSDDHEITMDPDGTARLVTSFGQPLGLKVWAPRPVSGVPAPVNSHGQINRMNQTRTWIKRPLPKTINHVVWSFPDVNEALDFYRDRLGFRLSEIQLGSGVYIRADGATDHHNVFLADAANKVLGFDGTIRFHHANFGVEDIDEIMIAKAYMERRGWPKSHFGLGRHRISSGAFLYLPCPAGGEAEYGTDIDCLDDRWVPRIWDQLFGFMIYLHDMPQFLLEQELSWHVGFCDPQDIYPPADTPSDATVPRAQKALAKR